MRQVFRQRVRVNDDVVNVYVRKLSTFSGYVVHSSLKRAGCVAQTEGHDSKLVRAKLRLKCGTWYMLKFDADLMVTLLQIHFCEKFATTHIVEKLVNTWQGVFVLLRNFVQGPKVNAQALRAIFRFLRTGRLRQMGSWRPQSVPL